MTNKENHIANTLRPGTSLCGMLGEFQLSTEVGSPACWVCLEALRIQRERRLATALALLHPEAAPVAKLLHEVFLEMDGYLGDNDADLCNRIASTLTAAGLLWED